MADIPYGSIMGNGEPGLRIGPVSTLYGLGLGTMFVTSNISTKTLVIDATGKFALTMLGAKNLGTGGSLFISIEIDGVTIATDLDQGNSATSVIYGFRNETGSTYPANPAAPIIVNSNIKVWLQKTGATSAQIQSILIPLE